MYSGCTVDMIDRMRVTREGKECMQLANNNKVHALDLLSVT